MTQTEKEAALIAEIESILPDFARSCREMRIPGEADQDSELIPITIPN